VRGAEDAAVLRKVPWGGCRWTARWHPEVVLLAQVQRAGADQRGPPDVRPEDLGQLLVEDPCRECAAGAMRYSPSQTSSYRSWPGRGGARSAPPAPVSVVRGSPSSRTPPPPPFCRHLPVVTPPPWPGAGRRRAHPVDNPAAVAAAARLPGCPAARVSPPIRQKSRFVPRHAVRPGTCEDCAAVRAGVSRPGGPAHPPAPPRPAGWELSRPIRFPSSLLTMRKGSVRSESLLTTTNVSASSRNASTSKYVAR
jgi:hypothetical protein